MRNPFVRVSSSEKKTTSSTGLNKRKVRPRESESSYTTGKTNPTSTTQKPQGKQQTGTPTLTTKTGAKTLMTKTTVRTQTLSMPKQIIDSLDSLTYSLQRLSINCTSTRPYDPQLFPTLECASSRTTGCPATATAETHTGGTATTITCQILLPATIPTLISRKKNLSTESRGTLTTSRRTKENTLGLSKINKVATATKSQALSATKGTKNKPRKKKMPANTRNTHRPDTTVHSRMDVEHARLWKERQAMEKELQRQMDVGCSLTTTHPQPRNQH